MLRDPVTGRGWQPRTAVFGVGLIDHGRRRIIELRIGPVLALSRPGRSNRGARTEAQTREDVSKVVVYVGKNACCQIIFVLWEVCSLIFDSSVIVEHLHPRV